MSEISNSGSGSDFLLDEWSDQSGSGTFMMDDDENSLNILYSILGATGFFICLYSIKYRCDKKSTI